MIPKSYNNKKVPSDWVVHLAIKAQVSPLSVTSPSWNGSVEGSLVEQKDRERGLSLLCPREIGGPRVTDNVRSLQGTESETVFCVEVGSEDRGVLALG